MDWLAVRCVTKTEEVETSLSFHTWSLLEEIVSLVPLVKGQEESLGVRATVLSDLLKRGSKRLIKGCKKLQSWALLLSQIQS
ncbi:transmembrane protein 106B, isoform CRA_b [Rattus norvegicus]|uniref:Transmembrane protein 106B, isoform CRA_b n=1 Tax=Rattus norvegicus TaxID=10116 RepID=A6IDZ6_RAT|nr:transmembrane protein 106B, isoform CRA_b [Rattus norvegicus]